MKKLCALLSAAFLFLFPACSPYVSKYSAFMMTKSNTKTSFSVKFEKLSGTYVQKIKPASANDGAIYCKGTLEKGEMNVYYDWGFDKELLLHIGAGESVDDDFGYYSNGATVYIILETVSECKGEFTFSVSPYA